VRLCRFALSLAPFLFALWFTTAHAATPAAPIEGFVETKSVRLQYLDWGGSTSGRTLILIHGLGDNPHVFDDLAPAFLEQFHVVAYARRGSGGSDVKGPYDAATLTDDLLDFMNALRIRKAALVGYSAGGGEVTELAARHPDRVERIVYFEGGYDATDPDFKGLLAALPQGFFDGPPSAMSSLDAFRGFMKGTQYPTLDDMGRIEANFRAKVIIQADGSIKYRASSDTVNELYNALLNDKRRDYKRVRCPALAIYAETLYDTGIADEKKRHDLIDYELKYWHPYQEKSIKRLQRELPGVQVVRVRGAHGSFFMTDRAQVIEPMQQFLGATLQTQANRIP